MAERPVSVKIGPYTYEIREIDDAQRRFGYDGHLNHDALIIHFHDHSDPVYTAEVFIHEILHAIHHHFCMKDSTPEEMFAENTALGLVMVWKDNPDVFKWWTSLLE